MALAPDLDLGRRFTLAKSLLQASRFHDALGLLATPPESGAELAYVQLKATAQLGCRQPDAALALLEPLISGLESQEEEIRLVIGGLYAKALHHVGRLEDARDYLEVLRRVLPDGAERIEGDLALIYLDLEQVDACRALLADTQAQGIEALIARGYIGLTDNQVDAADQYFQAALVRNEAEPRVLLGLAITRMMHARVDEAMPFFERCIACDPASLAPRNALAWCKLCSGDPDAAAGIWQDALDVDRNFSELHGGLAVVAVIRGDRTEAESLCRKALGLDSGCFSAWFARYLLSATAGNEKAAQRILDSLLSQPIYNDQTLHQVLSTSLLSLPRSS